MKFSRCLSPVWCEMRNSVRWGIALSLIACFLLFLHLYVFIPKVQSRVTESFRTPLNASCLVATQMNHYGTGVVLDTGYVLTAAHVVDDTGDMWLQPFERDVRLEFFGDHTGNFDGRVVYFSRELDFALIEADLLDTIPSVSARAEETSLGEAVFTIGAARGHPPMISDGFIGETNGTRHRTSCYVTGGNSGGGLFTKGVNPELVGIINTVDVQRSALNLLMPGPNGMMQIRIGLQQELNGISGFVPIEDIREELEDKGLGNLLEVQEEPMELDPYQKGVLKTISQTLLVLLCVYALRRQLFGK